MNTEKEIEPRTEHRFAEAGGRLIGGAVTIAGVVASCGLIVLAFRFLFWCIRGNL